MALFFLKTESRHSCDSPDWYTPAPFSAAAREVMGGIDLDPASDAKANLIVNATTYFTAQSDGLSHPWFGRIFLNPPGGLVYAFWQKLMSEWHQDPINPLQEFVWIGYSLEQLQTLQVSCNVLQIPTPLCYTVCFLRKRIAFIENDVRREMRRQKCAALGQKFKEKSSPSHANYIAYGGVNSMKFKEVFSQFGEVMVPLI